MAASTNSPVLVPLLLLLLPFLASCLGQKQVYIVHFGHHTGEKTVQEIEENHHSYLLSVKETAEEAKSSLVYSYKHAINGFAALLTPDEASKLSQREKVISVYPSDPKKYTLHTTRSWEFVGLEDWSWKPSFMKKEDLLMKSKYGKDVIVGLLDSGVWPESKSFSDEGMEPIPSRWKGICQCGDAFNSSNCNKKIIGARYYIKGYEKEYGPLNRTLDYLSPRDGDGHGTHTSSTVGGRMVHNASFMGLASGTASGGAPLVRLAIYKVCWSIPHKQKGDGNTCFEEDMLAAIDDAIADGVDVLSISIGTSQPIPLAQDGIAAGALQAIKKNIVVSCSAGNNGPGPGTLSNTAPWIITVGATTLDRGYITPVTLGNGIRIEGIALSTYPLKHRMYPLVLASRVVNHNIRKNETMQCLPGSLNPKKAKGKIIFCLRGAGLRLGKGLEVKRAGGAGLILGNNYENGNDIEVYDPHFLPATQVIYRDAVTIMQYIRYTRKPMAHLFPTKTIIHIKPSPYVAIFSSRGPNAITPQVLKPDIAAPGVHILAAWSGASSPTRYDFDHRVVEYNLFTGTSMACPHVAATLALLKAIHPDWSSAALRSAIMTTAGLINNQRRFITDHEGNPGNPFQFGSGQLRPAKAADPGLVYDASYTDYLLFACATQQINNTSLCPKNPPNPINLNYPSVAIPRLYNPVTVQRTVTNVGCSKSVYFASTRPPVGFYVNIWPRILFFDKVGERKKFTITVQVADWVMVRNMQRDEYAFGWFNWFDGIHNVRSPIAVSVA